MGQENCGCSSLTEWAYLRKMLTEVYIVERCAITTHDEIESNISEHALEGSMHAYVHRFHTTKHNIGDMWSEQPD